MMQRMIYAWVLTALVGCVPAGAEIGGESQLASDLIPDRTYQPNVGDRAVLYALENETLVDQLPLLKDLTAYDIYVRSKQTRNREQLTDLEKQGWLQWVTPGTQVIVVALLDRNHLGARTATQVRVPDENYGKQSFWTPADNITRMVQPEPQ
jgi:hypothetical protein